MSKLSQELEILYYLNKNYDSRRFIGLDEILDYLDLDKKCARQVRRYIDDLNLAKFYIDTKRGLNGGYRLFDKLEPSSLLVPNIALALVLSSKHNKKLGEYLKDIPNIIKYNIIEGDNEITSNTLNKLIEVVTSINDKVGISFKYKDIEDNIDINPYKVLYTNHTYYLIGLDLKDNKVKVYDVNYIDNIKYIEKFNLDNNLLNKIQDRLNNYGLKFYLDQDKTYLLRVKCKNKNVLDKFIKYYENKGKVDGLIFEVKGNSENELFYPLLRISSKDYVILNNKFKKAFTSYLEAYLNNIKKNK